MSPQAGTYKLGPDNATLWVTTSRQGAAAKAGHDLVIDVTSWEATLVVDDDSTPTSIQLSADPGSLRVREGSGGIQPLKDEDKADIRQTIDDEVLKGATIEFRSAEVEASDNGLLVRGDLELAGNHHPVEFGLTVGPGGQITGAVTIRQTDWGIKPYSALFGALRVADDVEVGVEGSLPPG